MYPTITLIHTNLTYLIIFGVINNMESISLGKLWPVEIKR